MNTKALKIFEDLNIPYNNGAVVLDAADLDQTFNFDEELTINEWQVTNSLSSIGGEINKIITEKGLSKLALFVVVADVKYEDLLKLMDRIEESGSYIIWGAYEPNDGEQDRVIVIMQ